METGRNHRLLVHVSPTILGQDGILALKQRIQLGTASYLCLVQKVATQHLLCEKGFLAVVSIYVGPCNFESLTERWIIGEVEAQMVLEKKNWPMHP